MSENPTGTDGAPQEPRQAPATNWAYLAIGVVFLGFGFTQLRDDGVAGGVTFMGVGATFIALAGAVGSASRTSGETPSDGDEPSGPVDPT